ncbi:MAG: hypothetical protein PWP24_629 [Clostridiales bacterium]|nr:hypothetical protein [Clostridiales bacterium]
MMDDRKLVLYIASSLDGYIATKDHQLDWLFSVEGEGDNGYSAFYDTVDTILIGRVTYDWIMEHENGAFPYQGKECYVFSRAKKEDNEQVTFLQEKLVDELIVTVTPVILGEGIPLFQNNKVPIPLSLKNMTRYNQFVSLHYEACKVC